ncbi:uncharacterized protein [Diabrotica undecimpunctata]|uniref:uncharacterized protein n=1 Tax=Diabrotica undecimpunctata TaxID=50387 RepID=UPI003B63CAED
MKNKLNKASDLDWKCISERILKIRLVTAEHKLVNIIVIYGINDDERAASKDLFWDKASEIIDSLEGNTIVLGDLNDRVGVRDEHTQDVLGPYGEEIKNDNGERIIDICRENNLIIMNTFFKHKDVHKYIREVKSRGERSIIDYVLVNRSSKQWIKDHAEHDCDLDQNWQILKEALLNGGKQACGITRNNRSKKCTNWWNNEIKAEVKSKKIAGKNYLRNGTADNYQIYKLQRIKVKDMVLAAKRKSWEEFGNKMEEDYHSNEKLFFKNLKNLRTEKAPQTPKQVRDKKGHLLHDRS